MVDTPASKPPTAFPIRKAAALLYLATIAGIIVIYLPQPILPILAEEFETTALLASLTLAGLLFGLLGSLLVLGPLSDRFGRKPIIVGCTLLLALPTLFSALADSLGTLLLLRVMQGLLLPGVTAITLTYLAEAAPPKRLNSYLGGYIAATVLGGILSRLLAGTITHWLDWHWAFAISGMLVLIAGVLLIDLPGSPAFSPQGRFESAYRGMLAHLASDRLVGAFAVGALLRFALTAIFTYLPFRLAAAPYEFSPLAIGLVYLVFVVGVISSPLSGILSQTASHAWVMRIGLTLTLAAGAMTILPGTRALIAWLLLFTFANYLVQGAITGYVAKHTKQNRGGANALYLYTYYLGVSLGAFLPGFLWPIFRWPGVVLVSLVALGAALVAALKFCQE